MKRILIFEDHAVNRVLLSTMLKKLDLAHDLAENGKVALEMIEYVQYGLVLMDICMPIMNGFEALEKIKNYSSQ
jgi:CheY-like chemotaxis protein